MALDPDHPPPSTRVIPGLSASANPPASNTSSAKRSRKKKTAAKAEDLSKPAPVSEDVGEAHDHIEPPPAVSVSSVPHPPNSSSLPAPPPSNSAPASISPVQQVQKRIRAATKKLQRIIGYENSSIPLNEDQKRAIASKPALEATVKELQDLLKILEEDEKLDALRIQAVREEEELKVQGRVDSAVATEQKQASSNLTFLLQFLHLYSLFNSPSGPGNSFVSAVVPAVVDQATPQEFAAVNALFQRLANGPISGGGGDALESIKLVSHGAEEELVPGVTFARIRAMVVQLTASPNEHLATPTDVKPAESGTSKLTEELAPTNVSQPTPSANLMFLQQSEVVPSSDMAATEAQPSAEDVMSGLADSPPVNGDPPAVDHVSRNKQILQSAEIVGSDAGFTKPADCARPDEPPVSADEWKKNTEILSAEQAEVMARTIDWAEDVESRHTAASSSNFTPIPPPPPAEPFTGPAHAPPHPHPHFNHGGGRGNYRGRGPFRGGPGGPRGSGSADGYRGGYRGGGYRGASGPGGVGYRGGRGGAPMDMGANVGWRPGTGPPPLDGSAYRPRAEYPAGRYTSHRGGPRGGTGVGYHRPPQHQAPTPQPYRQEVPATPGNWS